MMLFKKRRLPHNNENQLDSLKEDIYSFIHDGLVSEVDGIIQAKIIDVCDQNLELIPQYYLDNAHLNLPDLKKSISKLQSEIIFQEIRRGLTK
jgi:hypothetical protein